MEKKEKVNKSRKNGKEKTGVIDRRRGMEGGDKGKGRRREGILDRI